MQTSNGYAILSCTGNVKAMDRRLPKSLFLMVYTFTSSYVISTFSIIQSTNTIADRMRPMIRIELLLSRVCRHTKVPKPFQLEMHIIYGVTIIQESSADSMNDILRQLDQDEIRIVISKDIRRFRKIATVVKGLKDRRDMELLTKEIKTKVGTGGTYKDGQILLQGDHCECVKNLLLQKGYEDKSIEVL